VTTKTSTSKAIARKPRRKMSDARREELEARRNEIELAAEKVDQEAPDFSAFLARWGNRYGVNNLCRLWVQAPRATILHKYGTWQAMGRQVRRGETAIMLKHPRTSSDPDRVTPENPNGEVFHGASWMGLFDFAQTEPIGEFTEKARADADPALAAEVKRLRLAAAELHPDRGGTVEKFTAAWALYEAAKARLDGVSPS
jgi:hypothetical protein